MQAMFLPAIIILGGGFGLFGFAVLIIAMTGPHHPAEIRERQQAIRDRAAKRTVNQRGCIAGGDIVGGDLIVQGRKS